VFTAGLVAISCTPTDNWTLSDCEVMVPKEGRSVPAITSAIIRMRAMMMILLLMMMMISIMIKMMMIIFISCHYIITNSKHHILPIETIHSLPCSI